MKDLQCQCKNMLPHIQNLYTELLKARFSGKENFMFTSFEEMPVTLSVEQAAEALSISTVSLYKLIKKDKTFPAINMGRRIVIPKENLKKRLDNKVNN